MYQFYFMSLLVSAGLTLGLAFHAGLIGFRAKEFIHHRTLTFMALAEAAYFICLYFYFQEARPHVALQWILGVCIFLPSVTFLFGELTFQLVDGSPRWLVRLQKANLVISAVFAMSCFFDLVTGTRLTTHGDIETDFTSLAIHRLQFNAFGLIYLGWITIVFYAFAWEVWKFARTRGRELLPLLAGIAFYILTATNDFFVLYGFYDFFFLQHFGFMGIALGFSAYMSERYRKSSLLLRASLEKLETQQALIIQTEKLRSLGEMAAGVAHEINNPVGILQLQLERLCLQLEDDAKLSATTQGAFVQMQMSIDRIAKIVRGLKTFSRDSSQDDVSRARVRDIIEDTLELCKETLKKNGVLQRPVRCPADLAIACRPSEFAQVILNLVINAVDAMVDTYDKWIEIECVARESHVEILFTDAGDGIPADIVGKIMDPFFTTKEVGKGTGLGLSICSGIVRGHGGRIWVDTNYPNTRFVIEWPN